MPFEKIWVKALYFPRSFSGTVSSEIEKSRICNSYRTISVGLGSSGFESNPMCSGLVIGESRSTTRLFKEFGASPTE